jgi:hypothetical protein
MKFSANSMHLNSKKNKIILAGTGEIRLFEITPENQIKRQRLLLPKKLVGNRAILDAQWSRPLLDNNVYREFILFSSAEKVIRLFDIEKSL